MINVVCGSPAVMPVTLIAETICTSTPGGVPLTNLKKVQEHGKLFLELRTKLTVAGISKALAGPPSKYGQPTQQQ